MSGRGTELSASTASLFSADADDEDPEVLYDKVRLIQNDCTSLCCFFECNQTLHPF